MLTGKCHWKLILVIILLLGFGGISSLYAESTLSGSILSSVIVSDPTPQVGDEIKVDIIIDVTDVDPPDDSLGSFTGHLKWDPSVIAYKSNSGIKDPFSGIVNSMGDHLIFNGAQAMGAQGSSNVVTITFEAINPGSSDIELEYSAMAAAFTFVDMLPILTIEEGTVQIEEPAINSFLPLILSGNSGS
ncbi:MAG: hypothetical protein ACK2UP_08535 [Candidatus Promineifilaceae bacterium]